MPKLNMLNKPMFTIYYFASTMYKFLIRKSIVLQDLFSKQIRIDLNNLL